MFVSSDRTALERFWPRQPVMPAISLDAVDAIELAELLQFLAGWLAAGPAALSPSLLAHAGHPAYGLDHLRDDLNRFAFLLGGNDGEPLSGSGP
jgi:hypothetical protein